MEKRTFGKTGFQVSPIGFGGAPIGYLETEQDRATRILNLLLDSGVNVIDTASNYPGSEEAIANAIGHRRREFVLISKCGPRLDDINAPAWSESLITQTVDRSLRRLRTDVLDVMLLHSCDLGTLKKGEALGALAKARDAGKIRWAGYSGDNDAAAYAAALSDVGVIETSVSIADQANIASVLPAAVSHNVGVLAKRPIANAAWKPPTQQAGIYVQYASTYHERLKRMGLKPADLGFNDDAWPEIALRFTLSQEGVGSAIIGTTNPENAQKNLQIASLGPLPRQVVEKIRDAFKRAEADAHERWLGQT